MERRRVDEYLTADFWHNFGIWLNCKERGLPYHKGWAEHPGRLIRILQLFDNAETAWQNARIEKEHGS